MGKSRYSKTKAAGMLCGATRYKDLKFYQQGNVWADAKINRQTRRMSGKTG